MRVGVIVAIAACSGSAGTPHDAAVGDGASGALVLSPPMYDFGDLDLAAPAPLTTGFVLQNQTGADVSVTGVAISGASDFSLAANTCGATLPASAACTLSVAFHATAVGRRDATLEAAALSAAVAGHGVMTSHLVVSPGSIELGDVAVGSTGSAVTVTVTNGGAAATVTPALAGPDAASFTISGSTCGGVVALNGTCTFDVALAPAVGGQLVAEVDVTAGSERAVVGLHGASSTPLGISPYTTLYSSMLIGQSGPTATISLANNGTTTTGTLTPVLSTAEYTVQSTTCTTLGPGGSCDVVVQLTPSGRGSKTASITIGDGAMSARAALSAQVYAVTIVGASTFPDTTSGQTSATQSYTVVNASETATGAIATSLTGEFTIASNTCAAGVAPHGSCAIGVRFAPTSSGAKSATISVSASPGGSDSFQISANAI